jgi:hypothetical protein
MALLGNLQFFTPPNTPISVEVVDPNGPDGISYAATAAKTLA